MTVGSLSAEQIDHYRREGYVVVPNLLTRDEIDRYLNRASEIANGKVPEASANRLVKDIQFAKGKLPMPEDPEHALWKILNPDRFDPVMAECLRLPRVLDAVSSLIGDDLLAFLLMFIYKPPGVEQSVHPFHQDAAYFMFQPQSQCLGVWIPLDPVSEANGSLSVVPRSHELDIRQHLVKEGINFGALAAEGTEDNALYREQAVTMELSPGDCLLFSTHLLHRSGGNRTTRHRRVITLHMASAKCKASGPMLSEYGFTSVRGRTFEGCLQPVESPLVELAHKLVES
jgi:phytanoyl-CoA hydroxylase